MSEEYRNIDLTGMKPFTSGNTAQCYRLDNDKILKLYFDKSKTVFLEKEKQNALSLLKNYIPAPISYELVTSGDKVGIIYEMIDGKSVSETIAADGSQAAPLGRKVAALAREIHSHVDTDGLFRESTFFVRRSIGDLTYVSDKAKQRMLDVTDRLEEYRNFVHGDFHPNNILVRDDGLYVIDLFGFSHGCPAFDVATILFSFYWSPEAFEKTNTFNGLSPKQMDDYWNAFRDEYFGPDNKDILELLPAVLLLKRMNFEQFSGPRFSEEYCQSIREDVIKVFEEGQPCPALPI